MVSSGISALSYVSPLMAFLGSWVEKREHVPESQANLALVGGSQVPFSVSKQRGCEDYQVLIIVMCLWQC